MNSSFQKFTVISIATLVFIFFSIIGHAQKYYQISCDITIKEKITTTQFALAKGKASYNKITDRTSIALIFPERVTWTLTKDSLIRYDKGILTSKVDAPFLNEYNLFKLVLNGSLKNYGLQKSAYQVFAVEEEKDGTIISTWKASKTMKYQYGKVVISQKDNKLNGIAFFDLKDKLISKQIFSDYELVNGLNFPTKIIQINYTPKGENYKITMFENVAIK